MAARTIVIAPGDHPLSIPEIIKLAQSNRPAQEGSFAVVQIPGVWEAVLVTLGAEKAAGKFEIESTHTILLTSHLLSLTLRTLQELNKKLFHHPGIKYIGQLVVPYTISYELAVQIAHRWTSQGEIREAIRIKETTEQERKNLSTMFLDNRNRTYTVTIA